MVPSVDGRIVTARWKLPSGGLSAASYAIALDPSGKLTWTKGDIDGEHVITVLTEKVSDEYLAFLQSRGVSYLFGGRQRVNLKRVLEKLRSTFGIETLLLEGGGRINGSFLAADLIDELSVLVAPVADGSIGTPSLFDASERKGPARRLKLLSMEKRKGDLVWLRYTVQRENEAHPQPSGRETRREATKGGKR